MQENHDPVLTIDIAHPPLRGSDAESLLDDSLRKIRLSGTLRLLNIVHGYGSRGKGGTLKTVVKNWTHNNKQSIRLAIAGEDLSIMNHDVQRMIAECELADTKDFVTPNDGMTVVWVK